MTEHPLIAFLRARYDEDEAAAKAWLPFGNPDAAARAHVARHDPGRVLADVAAKRKILDAWADPFGNWSADQAEAARAMKAHVLRLLAEPFASHPDYPKDEQEGDGA